MIKPSSEGDTIIGIPRPRPLQPLVHDPGELPDDKTVHVNEFKIRLANTEGRRSRASYLIQRRYAWRGYELPAHGAMLANRITLAAFDQDLPVATISVGVDSPSGLDVERVYPAEVAALRASGASVCEFTKLAIDSFVRSKAVLAAVFHIAYIYAHRIRGCSDLLIEVNPRHVKFYRAMLGFEQYGESRMDPRVRAPAVLLRLAFVYAEQQIGELGGHAELAETARSLYPLFFSNSEEQGIEGRLRAMD